MRTYVLPLPGQDMPKGDNRRRGVVGPSVYMRMLRRGGSNPLNSRDVFEACSLMCTSRRPAYTGASPMYTSSPPDCSAPSPPATARLRDGSGPGFSPRHGRCGPFAGRVSCRSCAANRRRSDPFHEPESPRDSDSRAAARPERDDGGPVPAARPATPGRLATLNTLRESARRPAPCLPTAAPMARRRPRRRAATISRRFRTHGSVRPYGCSR